MKGFKKTTLSMNNFDIVAYYPYTSIVTYRIFEENHNYGTDFDNVLDKFWNEIEEELNKIDPSLMIDNKVVVELKPKNVPDVFFKGSNLFVGRYDGIVSVGLGVWQPDDWTKEHNRTYEVL